MARDVLVSERLSDVLWIPARRSPHKLDGPLTAAQIRREMVAAAIEGLGGHDVDDLELRRESPSHSVDTLRALHMKRPGERPVLILGSDQFETLHTWGEAAEVARLADVCVVARDGVDLAKVEPGLDVVWSVSPLAPVDVSSSDIRSRRAQGRSYRGLVPEGVAKIIEREDLYRG